MSDSELITEDCDDNNTQTNIINYTELRYTIPSLQLENIEYMKKQNNTLKLNKYLVKENKTGAKAIASQYYHKKDVVNDTTANANRHHTSSHYVMAGGVQFQRGCRVKGVVSRHSRQAAIRNGNKK
jgi:hypothetical protein